MSNTLIKNLQIGDQVYQLSGSSSGTGVTRGKLDPIWYNETTHQLIRPNSITSIRLANSNIYMVGIPHEFMQESGKLVLFCENFGILQDIEEYCTGSVCANKKLTILVDQDTAMNPSYDSVCYPSQDTKKIFKLVLYWNDSDRYNFYWESFTLDGMNYSYINFDSAWLENILNNIWEYENILIARKEDEIVICNLDTDSNGYSNVYNGYQGILYSGEIPPSGSFWYNEQDYLVLYIGPSYMEVNPVSHYMFNIVMPSENTLITNIPLTWSQDIAPEFGEDKLVQISVLDGVGTFNSISLQS